MVSLFELTVPNYKRVVSAAIDVMKKGAAHFTEIGKDPNEIVSMQLADDMKPFSFQVNILYHQAVNGVSGLMKGEFSPPNPLPEMDYQELIAYLESALEKLEAFTPEQVNAVSCKPMYFKYADKAVPFSTENFALSFTYPNLYFHAATIYDMLRMQGVPLGKTDFMGRLPIGLPEE